MKKLLSTLLVACLTVTAVAFPAQKGIYRLLKLNDGTNVVAELKGNHLCHYWEADDGTCYVALGNGIYQQTDRKLLKEAESAKRQWQTPEKRIISKSRRLVGEETHIEYTGMKKGLIIMAEFQDMAFKSGHGSSFYNKVANEIGFTDPVGFVGSVKDYFLAQSNGQFELDFDVVGPVKLSQNYAYYGQNDAAGNDTNAGVMVVEAMNLADELVDYADYDWDGDGEVDQIFILYAGMGEAAGGDENTVWPHEWTLTSATGNSMKRDGVVINTYACSSEILISVVYNRITGKSQVYQRTGGIGTICHEFTHCLGIPDMYDTHDSGFTGTGTYDPMCSGSYNENSYRPANYTAYERIYAGWIEPIELKEPTTVIGMRSASDYGQVFIIYNDANRNEYYLLENRQKTGWDKAIPSAGLLVTHVDYDPNAWKWNIVNSKFSVEWNDSVYAANDHERCGLFKPNYDNGEWAGSALTYPQVTRNNVQKQELTNTSDPAAILFNANTDGSFFMNKPITNIVQNEDGTISFDFMGGSQTNIISGIQPAIVSMETKATHEIYDLQGRKVKSPGKGIYIRNGRKVIY